MHIQLYIAVSMVNIDHPREGSLVKLGFNEHARSVGVKRV